MSTVALVLFWAGVVANVSMAIVITALAGACVGLVILGAAHGIDAILKSPKE